MTLWCLSLSLGAAIVLVLAGARMLVAVGRWLVLDRAIRPGDWVRRQRPEISWRGSDTIGPASPSRWMSPRGSQSATTAGFASGDGTS